MLIKFYGVLQIFHINRYLFNKLKLRIYTLISAKTWGTTFANSNIRFNIFNDLVHTNFKKLGIFRLFNEKMVKLG